MRRIPIISPLPAATLALCLAACSPYGLREQTNAFATAAQGTADAIASGQRSAEADRRELFRTDVGDGRVRPVISAVCRTASQTGSLQDCLRAPDMDSPRYSVDLGETPEQLARLGGIGRYARSLQALTQADDRAALDAASQKVASGIGTLAGAVAPAAPAAVLAGPVASAALFLVGEALDHERFLQLKRAVHLAHPLLLDLQPTLQDVLRNLRTIRIRLVAAALVSLNDGLSRQPTVEARLARFDRAAERSATLAALNLTKPVETADGLIAAHAALLAAIDDPRRNMQALAAAVQRFATQAETLRAAFTTSQEN